jgi:Co/Zn/Cd efflux system component
MGGARHQRGMFLTEIVAGVIAGSVSLHADALDFLGDTFNYAISLAVLGLALTCAQEPPC